MSEESVSVSVVLPAYNEAATIETTVETTLSTLAAFLPADSYEVIVAEDGCEDRTPEIADELAAADDRVRHFHSDQRLGRGGALERAFRASHGDTLVYFDTDLATDMRHLEELVESVRTDGYDVVTGSRWMAGNVADRPAKRGVPSRVYNGLTRLFLRSDLRDHQCGFKAFDREALLALLDDVEDQHWFWDTEVLVKAQRRGFRVKEFAVDWEPKGDTKVDLVRDVFGMGSQILRTWWQLSVSPRVNRRVGIVAGTLLTFVAVFLMAVLYLEPDKVWSNLQAADLTLVAVAAAIYVLSWPLRGLRYRDILEEIGFRSKVGFLTGAIFISQTGNLVFPARLGDGVRAYVMKARRDVPYSSGFASLAVERVFDLLTITVLAGSVMLALVASGDAGSVASALAGETVGPRYESAARYASYVAAFVGTAAVVAVVAIVVSARSDRNLVRPLVDRLSDDSYAMEVVAVVERFVGDVQTVAGSRRSFAVVGGSSLLVWTLDVFTGIVVMLAVGIELPVATLVAVGFFAVSVGNLAKVLPLSPGGVGLYEGAFTALVVGLAPGVTVELAVTAAIVDHAVKNVVTVIGGLGSMLALNVSLTEAVEESTEAREAGEAVTGE
ncbi:flippase-like domain-containing protein [Haloarchaeobius salinus]|uniref:flippase-like domain-containing protein n=1 Tax=Haloarchaeobius salinus TaxID=1198298 RepID=UPI002109BD3E|nr:flippase-like domain-containing protein [Haloarchaeobius salinus]